MIKNLIGTAIVTAGSAASIFIGGNIAGTAPVDAAVKHSPAVANIVAPPPTPEPTPEPTPAPRPRLQTVGPQSLSWVYPPQVKSGKLYLQVRLDNGVSLRYNSSYPVAGPFDGGCKAGICYPDIQVYHPKRTFCNICWVAAFSAIGSS